MWFPRDLWIRLLVDLLRRCVSGLPHWLMKFHLFQVYEPVHLSHQKYMARCSELEPPRLALAHFSYLSPTS